MGPSPARQTAPPPSGPASFVRTGPPGSRGVALTFHGSGDVGLAAGLLRAAATASAPITVFAVGSWLEANPRMAQTILAGGHEVANHTFTHPALGTVDRTRLRSEITRCRDVLMEQTGSNGRWFRPSGIERPTAAMLEEAGLAGYRTVVGYDVDPHDYQNPGAGAVAQRTADAVRPGSIVSLHAGHPGTVEAFPAIVDAIRARKLEPVLLSHLLGGAG